MKGTTMADEMRTEDTHALVAKAEGLLANVRRLAGDRDAPREGMVRIGAGLDALAGLVRDVSSPGIRPDPDTPEGRLADAVGRGIAAARRPGMPEFDDLARLEARAREGSWDESETRELVLGLAWHLSAGGMGGFEEEIEAALRDMDAAGPRPA